MPPSARNGCTRELGNAVEGKKRGYFEVQLSTDGSNFGNFGRAAIVEPYANGVTQQKQTYSVSISLPTTKRMEFKAIAIFALCLMAIRMRIWRRAVLALSSLILFGTITVSSGQRSSDNVIDAKATKY